MLLVTPERYPSSVEVTVLDVSCLLPFAIRAVLGDNDDMESPVVFVVPDTLRACDMDGSVPMPTLLLSTDKAAVKLEVCKSEGRGCVKLVVGFHVPIVRLLLTMLRDLESVDHTYPRPIAAIG
jgi:hypothetical protein